jgi:cation diffusion facilitator CzcD-associated flavoprotein CzcO
VKNWVSSKIEFGTELTAKWDNERNLWVMDTNKGQFLSRTTIFATGPITEAQIPKLEGLETFKGEMFHSAKWNHDYDLTGKRIAVIGTGASAIQFVPQIQPKAKELYVSNVQRRGLFQNLIQIWVMSVKNYRKIPINSKTWRQAVAQSLNAINFGLRNPAVLKPVGELAKLIYVSKLKIQNCVKM